MRRYTLDEFVAQTRQVDQNQGLFEFESERMLEVNLNGEVWMKMGAMVSYLGNVKFTREGFLDQGIGNLLKKGISAEGCRLTKAEGTGRVYLADSAKKITVLSLQGEAICVNGNDVLAFETTLSNKIQMMKKLTGILSGGLFNVRLEGTGMVALTSHYDPLTLRVSPGQPVYTDPNATVAWSANLQPDFKADVSFKTFLGRGSGESFQMKFQGEGFVVVQPYEEVYMQSGQ